jgi:predicted alpha/beta superfamily hydrolase
MDSITEIRKKVKKSIDSASDHTVRMVYALLEAQEQDASKEKENIFSREMQQRFDDFEKGNTKTFSHEELVEHARAYHKNRIQALK